MLRIRGRNILENEHVKVCLLPIQSMILVALQLLAKLKLTADWGISHTGN